MTVCGVLGLNRYADRYRLIQIHLTQIRNIVYHWHGLEEEAISEQHVSKENSKEQAEIDHTLARDVQTLQALGIDSARLQRILTTSSDYHSAFLSEFAVIRPGNIKRAEVIAEAQVDPRYDQLLQTLTEVNAYYDKEAETKFLQATTGIMVLLLLSILSISAFFISAEKSSRRLLAQQFAMERIEVEQNVLRQREKYISALLSSVSDIITVMDSEGNFLYTSGAVERILCYSCDEMESISLFALIHPADIEAARRLLQDIQSSVRPITGEWRMRQKDGYWRYFEVIGIHLPESTEISGFLVTCRDITERKGLVQQMEHQAFHDSLTGLPNRARFLERVSEAHNLARENSTGIGVMFIDLDNFKVINDSLGHDAGDTLLSEVARRLQACVRQGDIAARLGGDEFTCLLENIADTSDAISVAERILEELRKPIQVAGHELYASASIGIAVSHAPEEDANVLLRDADTAMYQAKLAGKGNFVLFNSSMNARMVERLELETGLRDAIARAEFRVLFQPILNLETGEVVGAEALVRWEHPKLGLISPARFIPIAEETGLIVPIGAFVLKTACRQAEVWHREFGDPFQFVMSVNLSGKQLQHPGVVSMVENTLKETGFPPNCLKLEITESVLMEDMETAVAILNELKALGVLLAIDDFGTGYSSLSSLQRLPVDTVKIDQSFVKLLGQDQQPADIVQAIMALCRAVQMNVTGEGIETIDQLVQLQSMGCDLGQGYHFSKPITGEAFHAILQTGLAVQTHSKELSADDVRALLEGLPSAA